MSAKLLQSMTKVFDVVAVIVESIDSQCQFDSIIIDSILQYSMYLVVLLEADLLCVRRGNK